MAETRDEILTLDSLREGQKCQQKKDEVCKCPISREKIVFEHFIHKAIFFFEKRNSLYLNRTATMARIPVRNMAVKTVRRITKSQQHTGFVF